MATRCAGLDGALMAGERQVSGSAVLLAGLGVQRVATSPSVRGGGMAVRLRQRRRGVARDISRKVGDQ
jgi:hypothetical protein